MAYLYFIYKKLSRYNTSKLMIYNTRVRVGHKLVLCRIYPFILSFIHLDIALGHENGTVLYIEAKLTCFDHVYDLSLYRRKYDQC